jgi:DNA helicase-2/ATP-dependent DNA helicase PcrA
VGAEPELDALIAAFLASAWAHRVPYVVEADVDTPIAGMTVRCRIDAVFSDGPDRYHVVDWKTGPPPSDPEDLHAKRLQLVLYRLAWARYRDVPLENVRASFHHVAANVTIEADDADPAQVTDLIAELTAGRVSP